MSIAQLTHTYFVPTTIRVHVQRVCLMLAKHMLSSTCPTGSNASLMHVYRADWEPAAASGRRVLGVSWGCPAALWGPSTPNSTRVSWKTLILKNWPIFPVSCGYVVDWPHVAQVRFWRPKRPHSEKRHAVWQSPSSWDKNCGLFKNIDFIFYFYGSKSGVLGQKTVFWGVLDRV